MGGLFGVVSKKDCVMDLFFGTDYHSHLGTRRGGLAVYNSIDGFNRSIHNIENSPFRTKFESDVTQMQGNMGIGCISDTESQPLIIRSHLGNYAITTVGRINNADELISMLFDSGNIHFLEMSGGDVNATELVAALINQKSSLVEGIRYAQQCIEGSMTMIVMTPQGLYAARDFMGRTPLVIGHKQGAYCAAFESFSYLNLGYHEEREIGPGEIVFMTADGIQTVAEPQQQMKICTFLWTYYGYTTSAYESVNVEMMRYECGKLLARRDKGVDVDFVAGIPDSGTAHAIGYANESGIPFARPFIKYTPTWPRSFMPQNQSVRNQIAHMKLIPIDALIRGKKLLFIDDSIVRGTQTRETVEFLYSSGAKEVHIRSACPPIMFGCKYLNFSRSTSKYDLITRRVIDEIEGGKTDYDIEKYCQRDTPEHQEMVNRIAHKLNFTSLKYHELEDVIASIGIEPCKLCTYCWNGKE